MAASPRTDVQLFSRERWSRKRFLKALATAFSIQRESLKTEHRTHYDTADLQLSLYRFALSLNSKTLSLQSCDAALPVEEIACQTPPSAVMDLPDSHLRQRLFALIEDLPLAPLFSLNTRRLAMRILDQHEKTTVRMIIEENHVIKKNKCLLLRPRIWIRPLKGYQKEAKQLARWCKEQSLIRTVVGVNQEALAMEGRSPGKYSVKRPLPLRPDLPVDRAVRRLLQMLLAMVRYNELEIRQSDDPRNLHDFRVAVRRARSLIGQTRKAFPQEETKRFRRDLVMLGRLTGSLRDLDAFLLVRDEYRHKLPVDCQLALQPFFAFLQQQRMRRYRTLTKNFETKRYRAMIQHWAAFTAQPEERDHFTPSVKAFILERMIEKYRALVSIEPKGLQQAGRERLHALRIECKKLRYLMDFFITAFPEFPIGQVLKHLKRVQRTLGKIQDMSVQEVLIQQFRDSTRDVAISGPGTRQALEVLLTWLVSEKQTLQQVFPEEFQALTSTISPLLESSPGMAVLQVHQ